MLTKLYDFLIPQNKTTLMPHRLALVNIFRRILPDHGEFNRNFSEQVLRLLDILEQIYIPTCSGSGWAAQPTESLDEPLSTLESTSRLPAPLYNQPYQQLGLPNNLTESVNSRLTVLEDIVGLSHNGTFFGRLTHLLDQVYGNIQGDWFCIRGIVITSELEALQHLELALNILTHPTNNHRRLSNIEGRLNLPIVPHNFINRLQRAIRSVFLNNNNNSNGDDNDDDDDDSNDDDSEDSDDNNEDNDEYNDNENDNINENDENNE